MTKYQNWSSVIWPGGGSAGGLPGGIDVAGVAAAGVKAPADNPFGVDADDGIGLADGLGAAADLDATWLEHGTESLTMAAVAERAGVSRRAVYLHFTSRAELLTELFAHVSEQEGLAASLQPVWAAPDAAADMLWALMSFDLLEELLVDRGWSVRRYRTHLAALFRSTFLCNVGRADEGALPPDP
jgi:Bacterial regulatory proteins, tetR family